MVGFHDQLRLDDPDVLARTISVDTMNVRPTDFDIDRPTQLRRYENGRRAAADFLDGVGGAPGWEGRASPATTPQRTDQRWRWNRPRASRHTVPAPVSSNLVWSAFFSWKQNCSGRA